MRLQRTLHNTTVKDHCVHSGKTETNTTITIVVITL
jgi:hypothetical protein